jgi:hypothetical protein
VADFNSDGHPDLVLANNTEQGTVSLLLGKGDGTFQAAQIVVHSRQYTLNASNGSPASFHTAHPGCGNFLFMDGSCHTIANTIESTTMRALCTRNNAEVIAADAF